MAAANSASVFTTMTPMIADGSSSTRERGGGKRGVGSNSGEGTGDGRLASKATALATIRGKKA